MLNFMVIMLSTLTKNELIITAILVASIAWVLFIFITSPGLPIDYSDAKHPMYSPIHSPDIIITKDKYGGGIVYAKNNTTDPLKIHVVATIWNDRYNEWKMDEWITLQPGIDKQLYGHGDMTMWYKSDLTIRNEHGTVIFRRRINHMGDEGIL